MVKVLSFILSLFVVITAYAQNNSYDSALAKKLGADEYGMKKYILVILKTGANTLTNKEKKDSSFTQHIANIGRLAKENKLVVAGPLSKNDNQYRGIFILNVVKKEEAIELLKTDAAISEKYLDYDLYEWYGSAALATYLENVEKVSKKRN